MIGLLLLSVCGFSQTAAKSPYRFWRLTAYSGQASIRANYRAAEYHVGEYNSKQKEAYFNGILQVRTQSFFVHPNFMLVTLNGIYNPQTRRNSYVGVPDYSEKVNSEGIDASAIFFKKRKLNLTANAILNNSIQNVENISRIRTKTRQYGALLSYTNPVLPLTASYTVIKASQQTIGSQRIYSYDQHVFLATATKSFTEYDRHQLSYNHNENKSQQTDSNSAVLLSQNAFNTLDQLELNDDIAFDAKRRYRFNSNLSNSNEHGTYNFKRFQANEGLTLDLPQHFILSGSYIYGDTRQDVYKVNYQGEQVSLRHKLFESLNSRVFFEHNQTSQTSFKDQRNKYGLELLYTKKIPRGKFTLGYTYAREYQKVKTDESNLIVVHEEYILSDNQTVLLKKQNINLASIVVRNISGSIIYQENADYFLIDRSPYIEIVRVPGGLINNNASVYIDYTALQGGTFNYYVNLNTYLADVLLFGRKLNCYYRLMTQGYKNDNAPENQILNYYSRHIAGVRVDFNWIKAGAEYEYYHSNLLPYFGMKYFVSLQKSIKKVTYSFTANYLDFQMTSEDSRRKDLDLSVKLAYSLTPAIKVDFDYMYRKMKGRGLDFNLHTSKLELTYTYRRLLIIGGANLYWNENVNSKTLFKGVYVQLTRNF